MPPEVATRGNQKLSVKSAYKIQKHNKSVQSCIVKSVLIQYLLMVPFREILLLPQCNIDLEAPP